MNSYEAMLLIMPDLPEQERKNVFNQISQTISSKGGKVENADIWADRRKLTFNIRATLTSGGVKKFNEALYYLVNFKLDPTLISQLKQDLKLNDVILRFLITKRETKS
jgi:small subunit ribosomal protein S6